MPTRKKSAEHLEEQELNKLLKYLYQNKLWPYYIIVRLGVSTALRFSDLSKLCWCDIINKSTLVIKEKKTDKTREIPIKQELAETISINYLQVGKPNVNDLIIKIGIRTVNKQIKIHAAKAGLRGKRISTHTWRKTFGREVWRRNNYSEASLVMLSELFKHSSVSITRIYLSITKEEVDDLYNLKDFFIY